MTFLIKGKAGSFAASSALMPTVVLPGAERCFATRFGGATPSCTLNPTGTTLKCKCACGAKGKTPACEVCPAGPPTQKRVFVSSTTHSGNLGNLLGADGLCQGLAIGAGLPGTFRAWLSSATEGAASRLTHATVPYLLPNGVQVADDWTDLVDGSLDAPIDRDEAGTHVPGTSHVWTGSTAAGGILGNTCGSWTLPAGANGHKGHSDATNTQWSDDPVLDGCGATNRLYCLEQ